HTHPPPFPPRRSSDLACQALRDDVDRPIATSGDNEGIAVMRCCQREPGRVRGVARFDELRCITTRQLDNNRLAPRLPSGETCARSEEHTSELQSPYDL